MKITEIEVEELHTAEIAVTWAQQATFAHTGSIDYKNDTLCWTAFDKILCADYNGSFLQNIRYVLYEGESTAVCKCKYVIKILYVYFSE